MGRLSQAINKLKKKEKLSVKAAFLFLYKPDLKQCYGLTQTDIRVEFS